MIRRKRQERPHAEGGGGDALVAVHRQDAAANDLGAEGRLVEREAEHGGGEAVEPDAERRQRVVEEDELEKLRRAAHEPDVGPRQRRGTAPKRDSRIRASTRPKATPPIIASAEISTVVDRTLPEERLGDEAGEGLEEIPRSYPFANAVAGRASPAALRAVAARRAAIVPARRLDRSLFGQELEGLRQLVVEMVLVVDRLLGAARPGSRQGRP